VTEPVEETFAEDVVADAATGVEALISAWLVPGSSRKLHYRAKRQLVQNWPVLFLAIERVIEESRGA
jgi:hypothetical protein